MSLVKIIFQIMELKFPNCVPVIFDHAYAASKLLFISRHSYVFNCLYLRYFPMIVLKLAASKFSKKILKYLKVLRITIINN